MTPEAQSKAARQRNELRAQAETIARLRREKMELLRDLKAAEDKLRRALLEAGKEAANDRP
jgi:hypothetical protein